MSIQHDNTTCSPSTLANPIDLPRNFALNTTRICGFNYPSSDPMQNFAACCASHPELSNACFHHCTTGYSVSAFQECIRIRVDVKAEVTCNIFPAKAIRRTQGDGWFLWGVGVLMGMVVGFGVFCGMT
ncbi:unnamed protein product [Zymoseptoria tritici ST99CH_1E4]|uniref:Uncharacterized protein n=1 Tax=Zymoseptoria tritici ST99CH_1E4 TaxID=1276532 RepID=A0A2H1GJB5_ZYMTR|nr:unnamed protein product [Zymoseptoria tritici ST99CH_1E4]